MGCLRHCFYLCDVCITHGHDIALYYISMESYEKMRLSSASLTQLRKLITISCLSRPPKHFCIFAETMSHYVQFGIIAR